MSHTQDTRQGVVLVFRKGITKEQAEEALGLFAELSQVVDETQGMTVHEFDAAYSGPVWYLP